MSVQSAYDFKTTIGEAGGIVDIAPYAIDAFTNEENNGVMKFGVGVVKGTTAGKQIKLPTNSATEANFEGVVTNRRTNEYDMDGAISIRKNSTLGVMKYGRVYVRIADNKTPSYDGQVYLLTSGTQAGYFTTDSTNAIKVNARYIGTVDATNRIAPIELFNSPLAPDAYTLPAATSSALGGVKSGSGVTIASDGTISVP